MLPVENTIAAANDKRTGRTLWRARVRLSAHDTFLIHPKGTATYSETDESMRRVVTGLVAQGASQGCRVLVGGENSQNLLLVHLALRELGCVIVPVVPNLTQRELQHQLEDSSAEFVVADDPILAHLSMVPRDESRVRHVTAIDAGPYADLYGASVEHWLLLDPTPAGDLTDYTDMSPWAVLYTSGSTGRPKGAVLPAGSFWSTGEGYVERFSLMKSDKFILPLTMGHALGALTAQSIVLHTGGTLILERRFSPRTFWETALSSEATVSILFPAQLNQLLAATEHAPLPGRTQLRLVISHAWHREFERKHQIDVGVCWGMTETGALSVGSLVPDSEKDSDGYVGKAMKGVEVAVVNATGRPVPAGDLGEIILRHEHVMLEYLNLSQETEAVKRGGWIHSGDIGRLDAHGGLHFEGRYKNLIKRAGENISPEEVENALLMHPLIVEAMVFGVPDQMRTEEIAAVVVTKSAKLDEASVINFVRDLLAAWKLPLYLQIRRSLFDRLPNGKINRKTTLPPDRDVAEFWKREGK